MRVTCRWAITLCTVCDVLNYSNTAGIQTRTDACGNDVTQRWKRRVNETVAPSHPMLHITMSRDDVADLLYVVLSYLKMALWYKDGIQAVVGR